jgi:hypothetical protein
VQIAVQMVQTVHLHFCTIDRLPEFPTSTNANCVGEFRQEDRMLAQQTNHYQQQDWRCAREVWDDFADKHPHLRLKPGKWPMHNFLRSHKEQLQRSDVIRLVRGRFWIADTTRFDAVAFSCATGVITQLQNAQPMRQDSWDDACSNLSLVIDPPREIVVHGLTPSEHLRRHDQLSTEIAEPVLNQLEKLRTAFIAAAKALPGCIWAADHMAAEDAERIQELRMALHNVNRG